ncbi:acyl-CoA dehydrogenase family protein [Sphingobium sp. EM0848]|uniref:acyl-CoA dehydrogenase family protein n=1 Tax=Sphingobium sp. EM0848 TaxID=2743473 RepID=UPI0021009357|nr:acyl-CoA dehydrogenase family protein [Sphingobium sp. EM0848]
MDKASVPYCCSSRCWAEWERRQMLPREFTEEQQQFRESYRRFLATEIVPHMEAWREEGLVDRSAFRKAGEQGLLMVWPDEKYGGIGDTDFRFEQIIIEENAYARTSDWYCTLHSRLAAPYFTRFGSQELIDRFFPDFVGGKKILAIAMSEPAAGSDLAGIKTRAVDKGDHWLLNGAKTYISNGINADVVIVAAKTGGPEERHNMTLFVVERGMDGFERGRKLKKMGKMAQDTAELYFNDVRVPKENVLGEVGKGFKHLMHGLAEERLIGSTGYLSTAQLSWDLTRDFVRDRKVFGQPLSDMQNTQFKMAEMRARLDIAQIYVDQCVRSFNAGALSSEDAARAKLTTSELAVDAADLGVQLHGGAGYMDEYPISRQFTDARIATIYAGSSEIMKLIISRQCLSDGYMPFNTRNF